MTRIEDAGRTMMKELGYKVELGQKITDKMKEDFGAYMAKILFEVIEKGPASAKQLMVTPPLVNYGGLKQVQHIVFSGGVSEHVYDRDDTAYGDIGPVLGKNVRARLQHLPKEILREPVEGIRATVIGAGEYTIQASGNTSYVSNEQALPVHGLKVIQASVRDGQSVSETLKQSLKVRPYPVSPRVGFVFDRERGTGLSVRQTDRGGVADILKEAEDPKCPLYLTLDIDIAKSLGGMLKTSSKWPVTSSPWTASKWAIWTMSTSASVWG